MVFSGERSIALYCPAACMLASGGLSPREFFQASLLNLFFPNWTEVFSREMTREILARLQVLAEQEKIRCDCDHPSIGIDVYVDRVDLVCAYCGSVVQIGTSEASDQQSLTKVTEIVMEPSTSLMLGKWLKPLT